MFDQLIRRFYEKIVCFYKQERASIKTQVLFCWLLIFHSHPTRISKKKALIIAPHQDDEVLGCGGLIALKRDQGIPVYIIFVTDGSASHLHHPVFKAEEIISIRKKEALTALSILGVDESYIHFLNKPDGKLKDIPDSEQSQIVESLAKLIRTINPGEIYVTHRRDCSHDHEAAYVMVKAAIAGLDVTPDVFQYPIWILWNTSLLQGINLPELKGSKRLNISRVKSKKRRAIKAYRSQYIAPNNDAESVLPYGFLRRFYVPYEIFFGEKNNFRESNYRDLKADKNRAIDL